MEPTPLKHIELTASRTGLPPKGVMSTARLLGSGATVPFIARYRKEVTGALDEVQIATIRDTLLQLEELDKRRQAILKSLGDQGHLSSGLEEALAGATTRAELEDIYLPYRPKRKTRASVAVDRGLEPLARKLMAQPPDDVELLARAYIDPEKEVVTTADALSGARDIMAEWTSEDARARSALRRLMENKAVMHSRVGKGKEKEGEKYTSYFDWSEPAFRAPSHRVLAMFRAEKEGMVKLSIALPKEDALKILERLFVRSSGSASGQLVLALEDAWKRLLLPSLETELRSKLKAAADKKAIGVFAQNLRQLLLAPPLGQKRILAIDPGFRTGCKLVCLDEEGRLLHNETIYPHPPQGRTGPAISKIQSLVDAYRIDAIAIGNATAGRETETLIRKIRFQRKVVAVMVNESGASVYSASDLAREEFPDYDVTVRGAVSIGRRLADPLSELVKIDPKAIGVGQYQHDVDQKLLRQALDDVVMSCVNAVGVEANTAGRELLSYVSGIGPALAAAIVDYRNMNGAFGSRNDLLKVPRLGTKAFEQAAGFIRVSQSAHPLDRSAVHPESYEVVGQMAAGLGVGIAELMKDPGLRQRIRLADYVTETTGLPTLTDIMNELARPGRDPRESYGFFEFDSKVHSPGDLREGMVLPGIVTNITAFGAFVDIGVRQDGLVHISELADRFVRDPSEVVSLNQKVRVRVVAVDAGRKRITLSMKQV